MALTNKIRLLNKQTLYRGPVKNLKASNQGLYRDALKSLYKYSEMPATFLLFNFRKSLTNYVNKMFLTMLK